MQRMTALAGALLTASLGLAAPSAAQGYAPQGGPGAYGPPSPAALDQNLASLHGRLRLAPGQEDAWQGFASAVRGQTDQMHSMSTSMPQPAATAPERFTQMARLMQQGAEGMASVAQALTDLYAVLTPGQRAVIESEFPARPGRPAPGIAGAGPALR